MLEYHVVSCEPCKRKKCKCDRKLPCCSQCSSLPSFCKYLHNNKRGIPGGYLNTLERRLDQTENALYNALAELRALKSNGYTSHHQNHAIISDRTANITKSSRMEEWKALPLNDLEDIQRWWNVVGGDSGDVETIQRGQGYESHDQVQYSNQDVCSAQRNDTHLEGNAADESTIGDSPANTVNPFRQVENTRSEDDDSAMAFSIPEEPNNRRVDGRHSFGPITAPTTTPSTAAPPSRSTRLSKSQQLTQAMNHMYY